MERAAEPVGVASAECDLDLEGTREPVGLEHIDGLVAVDRVEHLAHNDGDLEALGPAVHEEVQVEARIPDRLGHELRVGKARLVDPRAAGADRGVVRLVPPTLVVVRGTEAARRRCCVPAAEREQDSKCMAAIQHGWMVAPEYRSYGRRQQALQHAAAAACSNTKKYCLFLIAT